MSWMVLALLACGSKQPPASETPPAAEPAAEPAERPAPEPAPAASVVPELVGDWVSAACGPREYARELTIAKDGTWAARDLVSPCPPDVQCIWSGIVISNGTWTADEDGLTLVDATTDERALPRPTRLAPNDGAAIGTEGESPCTYSRRPEAK